MRHGRPVRIEELAMKGTVVSDAMHGEAAGLDPSQQRHVLIQARQEGWTSQRMRDEQGGNMNIDINERSMQNPILKLLQEGGSDGASLHELSQIEGYTGDQLSTLRCLLFFLECGEPIAFDEDSWSMLSDNTRVFLASRPEELEGMENMIHAEIDDLRSVLGGVSDAKSDLQKRFDENR